MARDIFKDSLSRPQMHSKFSEFKIKSGIREFEHEYDESRNSKRDSVNDFVKSNSGFFSGSGDMRGYVKSLGNPLTSEQVESSYSQCLALSHWNDESVQRYVERLMPHMDVTLASNDRYAQCLLTGVAECYRAEKNGVSSDKIDSMVDILGESMKKAQSREDVDAALEQMKLNRHDFENGRSIQQVEYINNAIPEARNAIEYWMNGYDFNPEYMDEIGLPTMHVTHGLSPFDKQKLDSAYLQLKEREKQAEAEKTLDELLGVDKVMGYDDKALSHEEAEAHHEHIMEVMSGESVGSKQETSETQIGRKYEPVVLDGVDIETRVHPEEGPVDFARFEDAYGGYSYIELTNVTNSSTEPGKCQGEIKLNDKGQVELKNEQGEVIDVHDNPQEVGKMFAEGKDKAFAYGFTTEEPVSEASSVFGAAYEASDEDLSVDVFDKDGYLKPSIVRMLYTQEEIEELGLDVSEEREHDSKVSEPKSLDKSSASSTGTPQPLENESSQQSHDDETINQPKKVLKGAKIEESTYKPTAMTGMLTPEEINALLKAGNEHNLDESTQVKTLVEPSYPLDTIILPNGEKTNELQSLENVNLTTPAAIKEFYGLEVDKSHQYYAKVPYATAHSEFGFVAVESPEELSLGQTEFTVKPIVGELGMLVVSTPDGTARGGIWREQPNRFVMEVNEDLKSKPLDKELQGVPIIPRQGPRGQIDYFAEIPYENPREGTDFGYVRVAPPDGGFQRGQTEFNVRPIVNGKGTIDIETSLGSKLNSESQCYDFVDKTNASIQKMKSSIESGLAKPENLQSNRTIDNVKISPLETPKGIVYTARIPYEGAPNGYANVFVNPPAGDTQGYQTAEIKTDGNGNARLWYTDENGKVVKVKESQDLVCDKVQNQREALTVDYSSKTKTMMHGDEHSVSVQSESVKVDTNYRKHGVLAGNSYFKQIYTNMQTQQAEQSDGPDL